MALPFLDLDEFPSSILTFDSANSEISSSWVTMMMQRFSFRTSRFTNSTILSFPYRRRAKPSVHPTPGCRAGYDGSGDGGHAAARRRLVFAGENRALGQPTFSRALQRLLMRLVPLAPLEIKGTATFSTRRESWEQVEVLKRRSRRCEAQSASCLQTGSNK